MKKIILLFMLLVLTIPVQAQESLQNQDSSLREESLAKKAAIGFVKCWWKLAQVNVAQQGVNRPQTNSFTPQPMQKTMTTTNCYKVGSSVQCTSY